MRIRLYEETSKTLCQFAQTQISVPILTDET